MRLVRLALRRETAVPILALAFASAVNVGLVLARMVWNRHTAHGFLIWNLFLAWLPLVFALLACEEYRPGVCRNWRFLGWAGAWLVFFPNAPYILTDLIHLTTAFYSHFWVDMVLILSTALTGLVLGFLSLYLMQSVVARSYGGLASWAFIAAVTTLSGLGICLGRFLRFNSWDVVFRPLELWHGIGACLAAPIIHPTVLGFPLLLTTFLFLAYVMLYGLTHLQQFQHATQPAESA